MIKLLQTFLQGKLTGLGLNGVMLAEVFEVIPEVATIWENGQGADIGLSGAIFAVASLWGWFRRFTKGYQEKKAFG